MPNCATGVIHYRPGVTSNMGADVVVSIATSHQYQQIDTAVTAPATVNSGETFKVRVAPSPGAIPKLQPSPPWATQSSSRSSRFSLRLPDPCRLHRRQPPADRGRPGFTAATTNGATATLCTTFNSGNCAAKAPSGNFINNSQPYIVVQMPDAVSVAGGTQMTMPTLEITLQATGAAGTVGRFERPRRSTSPSPIRRSSRPRRPHSTGIPRLRRRSTRAPPRRWGRR